MTKTRRSFMLESAAGTVAFSAPAEIAQAQSATGFWPNGARLAVLVSMIWESGAEPPATIAGTGAAASQTLSDVRHFRSLGGSNGDFEQTMKDEFDELYAEAGTRRRMMIVTMHDEVAGRAARIPVFERFFGYAKRHPGVWFARTSAVARWALSSPITPIGE